MGAVVLLREVGRFATVYIHFFPPHEELSSRLTIIDMFLRPAGSGRSDSLITKKYEMKLLTECRRKSYGIMRRHVSSVGGFLPSLFK
jgi:hypothetical protein